MDIAQNRKVLEIAQTSLNGLVNVKAHHFSPCYLWSDRPVYNQYGDIIDYLNGDTIYLYHRSSTPTEDLFHELGHVVARKFNIVGHRENGYQGSWERENQRLIRTVANKKHWSPYLNLFANGQRDIHFNAASEVWAELFMLWHLHPRTEESRLIEQPMKQLERHRQLGCIKKLANRVNRVKWQ